MAEERNIQHQRQGGHSASDLTGVIAEQASRAVDQTGRVVQQGVARANEALSDVTERSGRLAEPTSEVLGNFRSAIDASARSQPTTTVTLAALVGFIFGAFWRIGSR